MKNFWVEWALEMEIMISSMIFSMGNLGVICMPIIQVTGHLRYCTMNAGFLIKVLCFAKKGSVCRLTACFFPFWHLLKTNYDIISLRNFVGIVWKISGIPSLQLTPFTKVQTKPACERRWWKVMLCSKGTKQNFTQLKDKTFIIFGFLINSNNKTNAESQGG